MTDLFTGYHKELVKVAAVAVAAAQNSLMGSTLLQEEGHPDGEEGYEEMEKILDAIREERNLQEDTWGTRKHAPCVWMAILMEEVGKSAKEALVE